LDLNIFYYYLIIALGFLLRNYKKIPSITKNIYDLSYQNNSETLRDNKRLIKFNNKHKTLSKIPILRIILRFIIRNGFLYIFLLILIIVTHSAIKLPYIDNNFSGINAMKYNSYVEPAKYMLENDNPFHFQKKYLADPVNNPEVISKKLSSIPIMEWGLFLTFKAFPNYPLEISTRLFTNLLGIIIILLMYAFFNKIFSKKHSIIITFLFSINTIFIFSTYLTVYDSIIFIFFFLSLIFLF
jgi:hypothetical protein